MVELKRVTTLAFNISTPISFQAMFFMKIIPDPTLISKILPPIIVDNLRCVPTGTKTSGLLHAVKRHVEIYLSLSARPN